MFGLFLIILALIICGSILFSEYMGYCSKHGIGLFTNPRYEERIRNLEKVILELHKLYELEEK